jgi:hypothetical protein
MQNFTQNPSKNNSLNTPSTEPCRGAISPPKADRQISTLTQFPPPRRIITSLIITIFLALNSSAWGQTADQYTFSTSTGQSAINPTYTTWSPGSICDDNYNGIYNIGWTYVYEGTNYTQFSVNTNGLIRLGGTSIDGTYSNSTAFTGNNYPKIALGWDDLGSGSNGFIRYGTSGSSPNRILVIDYYIRNNNDCSSAKNISMQARLYENGGRIEILFITNSVSNTANCYGSATIGITGSTGTKYQSVKADHTCSNSTHTSDIIAWPGNGRMYTFTPPACTNPSISLTSGSSPQTICPGGSITNMVYTYSGEATGASVTGLPAGLSSSVNAGAKTVTISGTPTASGTFTITTTGHTCGSAATINGTVNSGFALPSIGGGAASAWSSTGSGSSGAGISAANPYTPTTTHTSVAVAWPGDWIFISVTAGDSYEFLTNSNADAVTSFVYLTNQAGTSVYASAEGILTWKATSTEIIRFYVQDAGCPRVESSRRRWVKKISSSSNEINYGGPWGPSDASPTTSAVSYIYGTEYRHVSAGDICGSSSGAIRFQKVGSWLEAAFDYVPCEVSFCYAYNIDVNNTLKLEQSANGTAWTNVANPIAQAAASAVGENRTYSLLSTTRYLRWTQTAYISGNNRIDDILVKKAPTAPAIGTITQPTCATATASVALSGLPSGSWTVTGSPSGSLSGSGTTGTVTGLTAGQTYTFTVTDAGGCASVVSADAVVNAQPATPSAPTVGTITQPTCATATASVALSGLPASGSWTVTGSPSGSLSGSGTMGTVSGLTANTTYTFTVTNASGCTSVASANAVVNAQPATPDAPSSVTSATTICHGNSVNLNATSADNTINWYTVETNGSAIQTGVGSTANHSVSPTTNTTYYAEAQNGSGCKSSRTATGLITVENPVSAINTAIGTTLQTNDYVWVGQTDAVWATVNNWRQFDGTNLVSAGSAPGSDNTNRIYVVQNSTSSNCIFNASNLSVGSTLGVTSFLVGTGTSLNLNGQNLNLTGNITINGTFTSGSGTITLSGSANQTLDGASALSFSNLTINKTGGTLTAQKDMTITGVLTLTNGILDMNSKTLTMGTVSANGTISGGSATSYIVAYTDGTNTSKLIHRVNSSSNTQYVFPIGTTTKYTPVQLTLKGGALSNAHIEVYTKNGMVTGMNPDLACYLNRSWFVEPTGITSPSYDIQLNFASGDLSGDAGFELNPLKLSGGVWYKPSGSLLQNGTTQGTTQATTYSNGSNPSQGSGTVFWNGLSSFSEFGGGGGGQPLPVELLSFNASCDEKGIVDLTWQTASEFNSSHFDLEKSRNGSEWQVIQTIQAAGNSNELLTYQAVDHANSEIQYYRLNQVDIDGTSKYYNPIAVDCDDSDKEVIQTYPNPSHEGFSVLINNPKNTGDGKLSIVDATGAIISEKTINIQDGVNVFFIKENLTRGIYFIQIENDQHKTKTIKHVVN